MRMPDDWVYVVDDDSSMRDALSSLVRSRGWHVRTFDSARAFLEHQRPRAPSCLILDVHLPGVTGPELHQQLHQTRDAIPVIYLTGHGDVPSAVRAMKAGAMEFLTKPVDQQTLLSVIQQSLARQTAPPGQSEPVAAVLAFDPYRLDMTEPCLWRHNGSHRQRVGLSPKALAVLCYLAARPGRLVGEEELLESLWGNACVQPEAVKSQLYEIRKALGDNPRAPRFIETLHRRGYRFVGTVRAEPRSDDTAARDVGKQKRLPGREAVLAVLLDHLRLAVRGQRHMVFVSGELGMGKTALMDEFQHLVRLEMPWLYVARGHCTNGEGRKELYYPLLEALETLCRQSSRILDTVAVHAPTWLVQLPGLLTDAHRCTFQQEISGATRNRMFREFVQMSANLGVGQALVLILEDLQWADGPTLDLLAMLAQRHAATPLLLIATARPVDTSVGEHPLPLLVSDLVARGLCKPIELEPLTVTDIVGWLSQESAQEESAQEESAQEEWLEPVAQWLQRFSGGNPLFLRSLLAQLSDLQVACNTSRGWTFRAPLPASPPVPDRVTTLIEAQFQRLTLRERRALAAAGRVGREFTAKAAARRAATDICELQRVFEGLVRSGRILSRERRPTGNGEEPLYAFVNPLYHKIISRQDAT